MFVGEYQHSLTSGKRLALPKKIRAEIADEEIILAKGFELCIAGYDKKTWENTAKQELLTPVSDSRGREIRRQMFSGAQIMAIDAQGRVVLPDNLLAWAGIKGDVAVIGAGDHFEIWDSNIWKNYLKRIEEK